MAKNGFGLKKIDEAFTYAIYKLVKDDPSVGKPWSAQDLEENCVSGLHPLDEPLIDQYYGPLCAGPHDMDDMQMYQYAVELAKQGYFIMIEPARKADVDSGYYQDDVKFVFNREKVGELKHSSEIKSAIKTEIKTEKPSTSGLSLKAGPSRNVARQTPYGKKKKKDPNAPKRPLTAFFLYSDDNRAAVFERLGYVGLFGCRGGIRAGANVASELGRMWRTEDAATKAHYKAISQRNMEKYKKDMEEYNNKKARAFDDY